MCRFLKIFFNLNKLSKKHIWVKSDVLRRLRHAICCEISVFYLQSCQFSGHFGVLNSSDRCYYFINTKKIVLSCPEFLKGVRPHFIQTFVCLCSDVCAFVFRLLFNHIQNLVHFAMFSDLVILNARRPSRGFISVLDMLDCVWELTLGS